MKTADVFGKRRGSPSLPLIWTLSTLLHIALLWGLSTMNLARGTGAGSESTGVAIEGSFLGTALDDSGAGDDGAEGAGAVASAPEIQLVSASVTDTAPPEPSVDETHSDQSHDPEESEEEEPIVVPSNLTRLRTGSLEGRDRPTRGGQLIDAGQQANQRGARPGPSSGPSSQRSRASRSGKGSGTEAGTTFFDIAGHGTKFVYVIDRSDSMQNEQRLSAARTELLASLEQLSDKSFVQVLFYNHDVLSITAREGLSLLRNQPAQQRKFAQFAAGIEPDGGTDHLRALLLALKLGPDAIFLLTDADEPKLRVADLEKLQRANRRRIPIHTVELGIGPLLESDNFLMRLARQSGGTYRYWNIEDLSASATTPSR